MHAPGIALRERRNRERPVVPLTGSIPSSQGTENALRPAFARPGEPLGRVVEAVEVFIPAEFCIHHWSRVSVGNPGACSGEFPGIYRAWLLASFEPQLRQTGTEFLPPQDATESAEPDLPVPLALRPSANSENTLLRRLLARLTNSVSSFSS